MTVGTLEVLLISAKGIRNTDIIGKQDPFAMVTCGKQKFKSTTAVDQGTTPSWNQKFSFDIYGEEDQNELHIELYDEDRFSRNDLIGTAKVHLANAYSGAPSTATAYPVACPDGKLKGEVKLSIVFTAKRIL